MDTAYELLNNCLVDEEIKSEIKNLGNETEVIRK